MNLLRTTTHPRILWPVALLASLLSFSPGCSTGGTHSDVGVTRDTRRATQLTERAAEIANSDPESAREILERAIDADPFYAPAQNNLGVICHQQGELNSARTHFDTARRLAPNDPSPRVNLAMVFASAGLYVQAERQYEETLAQFPANEDALRGLLVLRVARSADDDETIQLLERLAICDDPSWSAWARSHLKHPSQLTPE